MANKMFKSIKNIFSKIGNSLLHLVISIITLQNTGKWVSVITVGFVLGIYYKFLQIHNFDKEAFGLVLPSLNTIAVTVFGIIGGFKGAKSIVEMVQNKKSQISTETVLPKDLPSDPVSGN